MKLKKRHLLLGITVFLYLFLVYKGNFKNSVIFEGDEWEYQAIAVNHYYGHGFLTTGRIEDIAKYKISELDTEKLHFWDSKSGKAYYRSPFYPFFLSLCYQVLGISPLPVKLFQLLLVFVAGLLLIRIGEQCWGSKGNIIGIFSFVGFVLLNYRFAEHLMPESWQLLFVSIILYSLFFHYKNRPLYSIALGVVLGISVLNKGTTLLLFPIVLIYDLYLIVTQAKLRIQNTSLFAISFLIVAYSWSFYLSKQVHAPTFISLQTNSVLLDGNNEYCIDGYWHPEWRNDSNCFYNQSHLKNKSNVEKVASFYLQNPAFLKNLTYKVEAGFHSLYSVQILLILFFSRLSVLLFNWITGNSGSNKKSTVVMQYLLPLVAFSFLLFFTGFMENIPYTFMVLLFLFVQIGILKNDIKISLKLPSHFSILILNFFIFTILFYVCNEVYTSRYVKTMEGIILLAVVYYAQSYFTESLKTFNAPKK